jgi:hypothetical protein
MGRKWAKEQQSSLNSHFMVHSAANPFQEEQTSMTHPHPPDLAAGVDSWALAAYFDTFSRRPAPAGPPPPDVLALEQEEPLAPALWRAAQLAYEEPAQFLEAIFNLYLLESEFVWSFLFQLRQLKKRGSFVARRRGSTLSADYLSLDATRFLSDSVAYATSRADAPPDALLNFLLTLLDAQGVAQPLCSDLERILTAVQRFVSTQEIAHKAALYSEVDRRLLEAQRAAGRLAGRLKQDEETRKKIVRLSRLLAEIKTYLDHLYRDFFHRARLEVTLNTFTLPRGQCSPVEVQIVNREAGLASSLLLRLEPDADFQAREYNLTLDPIFGQERRIIPLHILPLAEKTILLRGHLEYADPEASHKIAPFQQSIAVSDPATFQPFHSPYITGGPVRHSAMFFGRREELERVIAALRGHYEDRITVIHGRRRMGKTSLLFQLKQGEADLLGLPALREIQASYLPVLMSFDRFTPAVPLWEVYHYIYTTIRREVERAGWPLLPEVGPPDFRELPAPTLAHFIAQLPSLLAGRKLLLMFDEFDTLIRNKGEEEGLLGFIRQLMTEYGAVVSFIFVGAEQMMEMMQTQANRLYAMAGAPLEVAGLTPEEARRLILEPMVAVNPAFEWDDEAVGLIVRLTAGHPYYIQTLCDRVVNNLIAGRRLRATTLDVEQGVGEIVSYLGDLSDTITDLESVRARIVLVGVAALTSTAEQAWATAAGIGVQIKELSPNFPLETIPSLLRLLCSRYLLDRRTDKATGNFEYTIRLPLLHRYIQNSLTLSDMLGEGGYSPLPLAGEGREQS